MPVLIKFIIKGDLPGLNEIISAAKKHHKAYAQMKRDNTGYIAWQVQGFPKVNEVDVTITWYCRNKKKDKDNIMAGQKFIFDALVEVGVMSNDGWKNIREITHKFDIDKLKPRIEVELREVEYGKDRIDKRA